MPNTPLSRESPKANIRLTAERVEELRRRITDYWNIFINPKRDFPLSIVDLKDLLAILGEYAVQLKAGDIRSRLNNEPLSSPRLISPEDERALADIQALISADERDDSLTERASNAFAHLRSRLSCVGGDDEK